MLIGIDFDNTIVCYDTIFHTVACEQGLIPSDVPANKGAVRDYLRSIGHENTWVEMQGFVYGPGIMRAEAFPGVWDFFRTCAANEVSVKIISHKTRRPFAGPEYDLHESALAWLRSQFESHNLPFDLDATVHLEPTKAAKIARIDALACDWFVDDLPEFLAEPGFPARVNRVLFDPAGGAELPAATRRAGSWQEVADHIFGPARNG